MPLAAVVVVAWATVTGLPPASARNSVTFTPTPGVLASMLPLTTGLNWVKLTCGSGSGLLVRLVR